IISYTNSRNGSLFPSTYTLVKTQQELARVLQAELIYVFWVILANTAPCSTFSRNQFDTKSGQRDGIFSNSCTAAEDQNHANFDVHIQNI
ncbi:uncharacterized protein Bfra_011945, partial [Botrytis fragariae]